jgi:hypothetical protein
MADDTKVYPGNLSDFQAARTNREKVQSEVEAGTQLDGNALTGAMIAEALMGLNYLIDGIRYSARQKS